MILYSFATSSVPAWKTRPDEAVKRAVHGNEEPRVFTVHGWSVTVLAVGAELVRTSRLASECPRPSRHSDQCSVEGGTERTPIGSRRSDAALTTHHGCSGAGCGCATRTSVPSWYSTIPNSAFCRRDHDRAAQQHDGLLRIGRHRQLCRRVEPPRREPPVDPDRTSRTEWESQTRTELGRGRGVRAALERRVPRETWRTIGLGVNDSSAGESNRAWGFDDATAIPRCSDQRRHSQVQRYRPRRKHRRIRHPGACDPGPAHGSHLRRP